MRGLPFLAALLFGSLLVGPASVSAQEALDRSTLGSVPTAIQVPTIGLDTRVIAVGQEDDGAMAAPTDPDLVGWYELGPGIGLPGNAVLAAHVDWGGRLRAFGRLRELRPGDPVIVSADGELPLTYRVQRSWWLPADVGGEALEEVFAQGSDQEITLITCGGDFDPSIRHYLSRLVVRAVLEPVPAAAFLLRD